ncbi:MAG: SDR family NAD(P)-dependent oxidoreductase, partial [Verrucomicrobiota bacterium]
MFESKSMGDLRGQHAVVTGGASGIGLAIAEQFTLAGAKVSILDFDKSAAENAVIGIQANGGVAAAFQCDVSSQASVKDAVAAATGSFGAINVLVNNAGIANIGTATSTAEDDFDRVMAVNVKGCYNCLHVVLPKMVENGGGAILNMSSIAA